MDLDSKYKKLLAKINHLDNEVIREFSEELYEEPSFLSFVNNTKVWTEEEHEGLKKLLEPAKNTNGYFMDKYGGRVSYNGLRTLKRAKTELPENALHDIEIAKCTNDFKYFRANYCLIVTKTGLARPEPRDYQENLEDELLSLEDLIILYPRQSGKTVTVATYLLWVALFHNTAINIGIVANKGSTAREVLDKIKKIYLTMPIWLMKGIEIWNKGEVEFENSTRIMTDAPSSDSFRGYTVNIIYEDESAYIQSSLYSEYVDSVYPTMNSLIFKQVINSSTPKGMNHFFQLVNGATQTNKIGNTKEITIEADEDIEIGGNDLNYTPAELFEVVQQRKAKGLV